MSGTSTVEAPQHATAAPERAAAAKRPPAWWASYSLLALLALFAVDCAARLCVKPDRYASANRSWPWWAVRDLRQSDRSPDIAIVGSSLMIAAVDAGDATFLNRPVDSVTHHRSACLEQLLQKQSGKTLTTASLAIGGEMASDVYALCKVALSQQYKPQVLIWGIAPRDLVDNMFAKPQETETVRYLTRVAGDHNVLGYPRPFADACERLCALASYIYGQRQQAQVWQIAAAKAGLSQFGFHDLDTVHTPQPLLRYAVQNMPDDNGIKQWVSAPTAATTLKFIDNSAEYKTRYNPFKQKIFETQTRYFDQTLQYCKANKIHAVIINMPLTQTNLNLLPAGVYAKYRARVQALAAANDATFIDFNDQKLFAPGDFSDTVHLNGLGGVKVWQMLTRDHWRELCPPKM